uniref:Uncharacterized protein n=1 Tax=Oryza barthii TaxID=65489 RepID=A0A0D3FVS3_9ORYZ
MYLSDQANQARGQCLSDPRVVSCNATAASGALVGGDGGRRWGAGGSWEAGALSPEAVARCCSRGSAVVGNWRGGGGQKGDRAGMGAEPARVVLLAAQEPEDEGEVVGECEAAMAGVLARKYRQEHSLQMEMELCTCR